MLDTDTVEVLCRCDKQMESIRQQYQPKKCLPIKPFEPEQKQCKPEQAQMFSPTLKIRKGTKVQILKNINFRRANKSIGNNNQNFTQASPSPFRQRTTQNQTGTTLQIRPLQQQGQTRCNTTNRTHRSRNKQLSINTINTGNSIETFPNQNSFNSQQQTQTDKPPIIFSVINTSGNNSLEHIAQYNEKQATIASYRQMINNDSFEEKKNKPKPSLININLEKRANTTKGGKRLRISSRHSTQQRMNHNNMPNYQVLNQKTLSPPLQTLSRGPIANQQSTFTERSSMISKEKMNIRTNSVESQFEPSFRLSPFNSSNAVGREKSSISIKRFLNPPKSMRATGTDPIESSNSRNTGFTSEVKTETGSKQTTDAKPLVKIEKNTREFRKRLSSFVIKRNQKLTNSRYASMIESANQERLSKKMYYFDPTFNQQLQQMNLELQAIIAESQKKSMAELEERQKKGVQLAENNVTPISGTSTVNAHSALKARIDTE